MSKRNLLAATCILFSISLCTGCTYYRVRDASSGREYITNNWNANQNPYTGSMALQDLKTGKTVVLQSYELERISSEDAKAEIGTR